MAIQEYSPFEEPGPSQATIWPVEVSSEHLRYLMAGYHTEYYVSLGDTAIGLLLWDANSQEGFIDGIEPEAGADEAELKPGEWDAIAISMHGLAEYTRLRRITHPAGSKVFLEPL